MFPAGSAGLQPDVPHTPRGMHAPPAIGYNDGMLAALLLAAACAPAPGGNEGAYQRVVTRAVERAHAELVAGIEFEVDHSRWENPWVVTTAHYEVRATRSYLQTLQYAKDLEYMHGEFVKLLGEGQAQSKPLPVWILPNMSDYNRFGNDNGAEHSSLLGGFYSFQHPERPAVSYQNGNPTRLGMWLTHAAVHQFLEQSFGTQQTLWVDEGLASYFALYWNWAYGAEELERIEGLRTYLPLERLVADPLAAYARLPDDRFIQLGMLFRFLRDECESTRNGATGDPSTGPFQEFLRAAVRGEPVEETEFAQTLDEASALLEDDFKAFAFPK
jgi:hypothetical protein